MDHASRATGPRCSGRRRRSGGVPRRPGHPRRHRRAGRPRRGPDAGRRRPRRGVPAAVGHDRRRGRLAGSTARPRRRAAPVEATASPWPSYRPDGVQSSWSTPAAADLDLTARAGRAVTRGRGRRPRRRVRRPGRRPPPRPGRHRRRRHPRAGRRRGRHVAGQHLPGRGVRRAVAPLQPLVRPQPQLVAGLRRPARDPRATSRTATTASTSAARCGPAPRSWPPPGRTTDGRWHLRDQRGERARGPGRRLGHRHVPHPVDPGDPGPRRLRGDDVPLGPLGPRPRPHRPAGRGRRHRRQRHPDRAGDRRARRPRRRLPAQRPVDPAAQGPALHRRAAAPVRRRTPTTPPGTARSSTTCSSGTTAFVAGDPSMRRHRRRRPRATSSTRSPTPSCGRG